MKTSVLIAATSAVLAMASPLEKRKYVTTIETHYQTVTVTASDEVPAPTPLAIVEERPHSEPPVQPTVVVVTKTYAAQPKPDPTTPIVVTVTQSEKAPEPTTTSPEAATTSPKPTEAAPTSEINAPQPTAPADDDFQGSALYHHNVHRANHSSPEVTWDSKIAGYAGQTAAKCVFGHDMDVGDGGYGQNIAMWAVSSGAEDLGEAGAIKMATTDMWYNGEIRNFRSEWYGQKSPDMSNFDTWGHYTQVIWKGTTKLGCAVQFCPDGQMVDGMDAWYMVCNYGPPGNIFDHYAENVLAPLGEPTVIGA